MDHAKVGKLIYMLRKENGMTQLQLAQRLHVSDKTVSKWERGLGCPDVSLLSELSNMFHVDLSQMLSGQLAENASLSGSLKNIKLYVCPNCGNILTALTDTSISCCGKKLLPLEFKKATGTEQLTVERIENDYYISSGHEMRKNHYISFIALITSDTITLRKLYPEWDLQVRLPCCAHGRLAWYCTQHGLFYQHV